MIDINTYDPRNGFYAKVIADSASEVSRITTLELRYPRFIHSEFMTHRMFSRNASSSRAIPVKKMIDQVRDVPAMPIHWGKNQPGMQAREELSDLDLAVCKGKWITAAETAARLAEQMSNTGAHKQIVNRLLEPFQWITVVVTATEWDNFFDLRDHEDAQPEIRYLAQLMRAAMNASKPVSVDHEVYGEDIWGWHLPYVSTEERNALRFFEAIRCSVARCARVAYLNHDGSAPDIAKDLDLFTKLIESKPAHASPAEHQARPAPFKFYANFYGWRSYRNILGI